ncbi:MAG TPA: ABC transporter ATP-binding protein, partial [Acidimicrobiales bacterium]|nr:ABC transporter ATP-binding protein [Acidimicrobiales bacterium]
SLGRGSRAWSPVRDVSFDVAPGEMVGVVGESGSGKSLSCRAILRILPPGLRVVRGRVMFGGADVLGFDKRRLHHFRRSAVGMVFQDPFSSLNPTYTVGSQLGEVLRISAGLDRSAARARSLELLEEVEIDDPQRCVRSYPDELSGGMRQRVMIAMAIAPKPQLLIADEATTALDVTTQAQILALLRKLRAELGMAILLISHDFGVVAENCERIVVMYGGYVVESGGTSQVYNQPRHPYTGALLRSIPMIESAGHPRRRQGIPGRPPEPGRTLPGCPFAPRCGYRRDACERTDMALVPAGPARASACPFVDASKEGAAEGPAAPTAEPVSQ